MEGRRTRVLRYLAEKEEEEKEEKEKKEKKKKEEARTIYKTEKNTGIGRSTVKEIFSDFMEHGLVTQHSTCWREQKPYSLTGKGQRSLDLIKTLETENLITKNGQGLPIMNEMEKKQFLDKLAQKGFSEAEFNTILEAGIITKKKLIRPQPYQYGFGMLNDSEFPCVYELETE